VTFGTRALLRASASLARHRALILVTLVALAVRLVWNLAIHNPVDHAYSDMGGYLARADEMLTRPWLPPKGPWPKPEVDSLTAWLAPRLFGPKLPHLTLYPYGTHAFLGLVKAAFGMKNRVAIGASFAVLGALAVAYSYATAARFTRNRGAQRAVAIVLIGYYPWISLGGYALSEIPFTLCVAAIAFHGLRLADLGRARDAWLLGLWLSLGALVRPQILVSIPLLGLLPILRPRAFRHFSFGFYPRVALPIALVVALSAWRVHWHLGTRVDSDHLISTNGPMNRVFARCHNTALAAKAHDGSGWFGPPSLGALWAYEHKEHRHPLLPLDPARGTTINFRGHMWDAAPTNAISADCVKKTGYLRQARYAITHVALLWGYNIIWPDMGNALKWRVPMAIFCFAHAIFIMPPAALSMFLAFRRRRARSMLLALHLWGLLIVSMLYFGDTRYRAPYDGILTILAVVMYAEIVPKLGRFFEKRRFEKRRFEKRRALKLAR
jgi:hypothetical protein